MQVRLAKARMFTSIQNVNPSSIMEDDLDLPEYEDDKKEPVAITVEKAVNGDTVML